MNEMPSVIPESFYRKRDSSIKKVVADLCAKGALDIHCLSGRVLNCGCYAGTSNGIGSYGGKVTHLERNRTYIDLGIQMGVLDPSEVICADVIDYLQGRVGGEKYHLISFFGAPDDLDLPHFFHHAVKAITDDGAVIVTGYPEILKRREALHRREINVSIFESPPLHPWDSVVMVGKK